MDSGVRSAGAAEERKTRPGVKYRSTEVVCLSVRGVCWRCVRRGVPMASMPGGLPMARGRSPGVELVPGVGASFLGVGVLDFRPGVDDLSF